MASTPEEAPSAEPIEIGSDAERNLKPTARWPGWLNNFVLGGGVLAIVVGLGSLTLARYDIIDKLAGFIGFMSMMMPAAAVAVAGVIALIVARIKKVPSGKAAVGLVLALGLIGAMYFAVIRPAGAAPALHDITTNVDNPPQFATLSLREDNLIPFASLEEWRAAHRQGYPDIAPILIDKNPSEVLADARALAESKGWTIANVDAQGLQLEATAYAGYLRFRDDVIVKVTPVVDGSSRVDMRSVSRVGLSDLGYNAARIREFLGELQAS
ncbi:MAG: DUF1499 domain-containing protein [Pseudomonadota bacterium]